MTLEGRIKRLEREWDYPANPGPDPEKVAHWANLWTPLGIEESRATALALEFLEYCQSMWQTPFFGYGPGGLLTWCEGNIGGGEDARPASGGAPVTAGKSSRASMATA